ncbi:MAG TPA: ATP-dependent helicase, partial [bacterium]|nr:ATP-dependent helicase [bacterium]
MQNNKKKLNNEQKEAVNHKNGPLMIIAGAGTGKTTVVTERIINIINQKWAEPDEILALTFTEKAANEMIERVDIGVPYGFLDMWISTFHSFCDQILKQDGFVLGLDANYKLMSNADSYIFLRNNLYKLPFKKLKPEGDPTYFISELVKHFSRLQDENVSPDAYKKFARTMKDTATRETIQELADIYSDYTNLKKKNGLVDFGDLMIEVYTLFTKFPDLLEKYHKKFKYIIVDEYQDTNYIQNLLVNSIAIGKLVDVEKGESLIKRSAKTNITVVGDDDQAIYKFRGAAVSNILEFSELYPSAKKIVLTNNYRSAQEILDIAYNSILNNNPNRLEYTNEISKKLIAKSEISAKSECVKAAQLYSEEEEAEYIVNRILSLTGNEEKIENSVDVLEISPNDKQQVGMFEDDNEKEGDESAENNYNREYDFREIAVLLRSKNHGEILIRALRHYGIPYKFQSSRGLYSRPEVSLLISFLRLLIDRTDINFFRILSMEEFDLTPRDIVEILHFSRTKRDPQGRNIFNFLEELWEIKLGDGDIDEDDIRNYDLKKQQKLIERTFSKKGVVGIANILMIINEVFNMIGSRKSIVEILFFFFKESGIYR